MSVRRSVRWYVRNHFFENKEIVRNELDNHPQGGEGEEEGEEVEKGEEVEEEEVDASLFVPNLFLSEKK